MSEKVIYGCDVQGSHSGLVRHNTELQVISTEVFSDGSDLGSNLKIVRLDICRGHLNKIIKEYNMLTSKVNSDTTIYSFKLKGR